MQENTWAMLRDSRPGARAIHATYPTYFPAFLYFKAVCVSPIWRQSNLAIKDGVKIKKSTNIPTTRLSSLRLRCWQNPQMARTALMRTTAIWSGWRPRTVASTKAAVEASDSWSGNLLPIHRQRPKRNGDAGKEDNFEGISSRAQEVH